MPRKNALNRRDFIKAATAAACMAGGVIPLSGCDGGSFLADNRRPNIILITADDLGWKDLPCYGNRDIATPNLDRIAREGVKFTNAFVVASSCAPSRASLITGQYPHTNGVTGLTHIYKTKALSPFHTTLPGLLENEGYNTALQGKWHVSPYLLTSWYGYNERLSGMFSKGMHIDDSEKTIDFIRRNKDNRFYLELNATNNHRDESGEFHFDPDFPVDPSKIRVPEYWTLPDWPEIREDVARYYSQTMKMDHLIGKVLEALDDLGLTGNTMVVFMSDNGPPYPGNKMTLYDRGTGTPLLVRWPKRLDGGQVKEQLVNSIDIMPTILEAAGVKIPAAVEGRSFFPVMQQDDAAPTRTAVFTEMTHHVFYLPSRAARTRRWKYIRNYSDIAKGLDQNHHDEWAHRLCELPNQPWKRPRKEEELYDLLKDPNEQRNLAADPATVDELRKMRKLLKQHMEKTKDPYLGKPFTHDYDPKLYEKHKAGDT